VRILLNVLMTAALVTLVASCAARMAQTRPPTSAESAAIVATMDAAWEALSLQDLTAFKRHVTPEWHLYTARAARLSAEQLFQNHRQNMTNFRFVYSEVEIHVHGDMAWVTHDATMSGLWQGNDWGGDFIFTNVFVREGGGWKITHMHESRRPD